MFQKTQIQISKLLSSPKAIFVVRVLIFAFMVGASLLFPESALADGPSPGGFTGGTTDVISFFGL